MTILGYTYNDYSMVGDRVIDNVESYMKFFDDVKIVDLGSNDQTVDMIKQTGVSLLEEDMDDVLYTKDSVSTGLSHIIPENGLCMKVEPKYHKLYTNDIDFIDMVVEDNVYACPQISKFNSGFIFNQEIGFNRANPCIFDCGYVDKIDYRNRFYHDSELIKLDYTYAASQVIETISLEINNVLDDFYTIPPETKKYFRSVVEELLENNFFVIDNCFNNIESGMNVWHNWHHVYWRVCYENDTDVEAIPYTETRNKTLTYKAKYARSII